LCVRRKIQKDEFVVKIENYTPAPGTPSEALLSDYASDSLRPGCLPQGNKKCPSLLFPNSVFCLRLCGEGFLCEGGG
jgi:hypothetical protein